MFIVCIIQYVMIAMFLETKNITSMMVPRLTETAYRGGIPPSLDKLAEYEQLPTLLNLLTNYL